MIRTQRLLFLAGVAVLVAVSACASGSSTTPAAAPRPVVVNDDREAALSTALGTQVTVEDHASSEVVAAAPDRVHQVLVVTYTNFGLPPTVVNAAQGLVAATDKRVSVRLAGEPMARFLSCGETMTGPRANHDRIELSVISRVRPATPSGSRIDTRVVATAVDVIGTGTRQPCTTTGELELRIHRAVKTALGS